MDPVFVENQVKLPRELIIPHRDPAEELLLKFHIYQEEGTLCLYLKDKKCRTKIVRQPQRLFLKRLCRPAKPAAVIGGGHTIYFFEFFSETGYIDISCLIADLRYGKI